MDLIIVVIFAWLNGQLAGKKGKNQLLWGMLTVLAYFIIGGIAGTIYIISIYRGPMDPQSLMNFLSNVQRDIPKTLLLIMFSVGGCLLVRFILERSPDQKREE